MPSNHIGMPKAIKEQKIKLQQKKCMLLMPKVLQEIQTPSHSK
jgi:hypothetical protein